MFKKLVNSELGRPSAEEYKEMEKLPVTLVLDNIRSQHNVGSAFRTSDAFLVEKVILCGICATPPTPEIHKSALGAEFSVEWSYVKETVDAVKELRRDGYTIVGVEQTVNSTSLSDFTPEPGKKYALVFGNEVKGVSQDVIDLCDMCLEIPQWGTKHSLNVSVSAGVVLWEVCKKLRTFLAAISLIFFMCLTSCSQSEDADLDPMLEKMAYYDTLARGTDSLHTLVQRAEYYQEKWNMIGEREYRLEIGLRYRDSSLFVKSIHEHIRALEISTHLEDTLGIVEMLNEVGQDYYRLGSMEESASFCFMALDYCNLYPDKSSPRAKNAHLRTLDNVGNIYLYVGRYDEAEHLFREALSISYDMGNSMEIARSCINLSDVFLEYNALDSVVAYCSEAMLHYRKSNSDIGLARCYKRMGIVSDKEGDYQDALDKYLSSYSLFRSGTDFYRAAEVSISMADLYARMGNFPMAFKSVETAMVLSEKIHSEGLYRSAYYTRSSIHWIRGDYKAAYDDLLREDSMEGDNEQIEFFQMRLDEIRRRNHEALKIRDSIIRQEKESKHSLVSGSVIGGLLLLVIIALLIRNYRTSSKAVKTLEEAAEIKSDFYTSVTHEFRTPLSIIMGQADMIGKRTSDPKVHQMTDSIYSQSKHLANVVNELLDIAKLDNSVNLPEFRRGDICVMLRMMVEHFRTMATQKMVDIEFASEVPSIKMDFVPYYMQKIVMNLVSNAIKFTQKGGNVYVTAASKDNNVVITVADTGEGIDSDDLAHIFEPFYQGHSSQADLGTGIGLTLTKQMTLAMGGEVEVFSIRGEGTSFVLTIPQHTSFQSDVSEWKYVPPADIKSYMPRGDVESSPDEEPSASGEGDRPLVLIVEDHREISKYISQVLGDGYKYIYADTGIAAVSKANEFVPDVIITDLMMPQMNGYDVIRYVRGSDLLGHIPVVAVSALGSMDDRLKVLSAGADAFIAKPFDPRELSVTISNLLQQRKDLQKRFCTELQQEEEPRISSVEMDFLVRLKHIINANLQNPDLNSDFISQKIFLSRSQVNRKVKSLTGMDTATFIRTARLSMAREMLRQTSLPVSDIAIKCGFEHQSYFNKLFKQEFGVTPSEARK